MQLLTLTDTAQLIPNQISLSKQEIESHKMKEMYAALRKRTCGKDDLAILQWGEEVHLEECARLELTQP